MSNLWSSNHPRQFWQCFPNPADAIWQDAIKHSVPLLGLREDKYDTDFVLTLTLGEARFGPNHWNLGLIKRAYYLAKPLIPRMLIRRLRQLYHHGVETEGK